MSNGQKNRCVDNFDKYCYPLSVVLLVFLKEYMNMNLDLTVITKLVVEGKHINLNVRLW